jgi:hypothetical protein
VNDCTARPSVSINIARSEERRDSENGEMESDDVPSSTKVSNALNLNFSSIVSAIATTARNTPTGTTS